jgi:SAM-dependent methyltransferase
MFVEESIWIKETLKDLNIDHIEEVLDVGSSTIQFRTQTQPHIDKNIFSPLRDRGASISYMDKKKGAGIDYVFDTDIVTAKQIGKKFDLVICCSLLEHVKDPKKICSLLVEITKPGGFLLISVPANYRYHPDPIDTMFRPSMKKLISMFQGLKIIKSKVIYIKDKEKYILSSISEAIKYIIPALNWKVNCLLMRKC